MSELGVGLDVGSDGVVLVRDGDAALLDVPVSAELSGRVGDHVPLVVLDGDGHHVLHGHELFADIVADALADAAVPTPDPVTSPVAVAVPGWWTKRAVSLVGRSLAERGLGSVLLVHDAEAAVLGHRAGGTTLPATVMVVDLGAQSCSAGIVESCDLVPRAVGSPGPVHLEGGNELDALVLHHVLESLAALGTRLEPTDPEHVEAARAFLAECRRLREDLSGSSVVTVAPSLPGEARRLRVVREELEGLAAPWLDGVLRLVGGCLEQYRGEVDAVLLVGGLARTPLVARAISAELDLDVLVDDDPRTTIARGAATLAVPVEVPQERRRSRLRRSERGERRRLRRAIGPAARDEMVALPAAPSIPQPEFRTAEPPPSLPRFEAPVAPAPVEDDVADDDVVDAVVVEEPVVEEPVADEPVAEVSSTDGTAPEDVPADAAPRIEPEAADPDVEEALTEQAVVEAEVDAEPSPSPEPVEQAPAPQVLAPEPDAVPAPPTDALEEAVAQEQPAGDPHALDVTEVPATRLEIAGEAPPIGARVRRSAGLLDAALGASALDTGRFLVDGPAPRPVVEPEGTAQDDTTTSDADVDVEDAPVEEPAPTAAAEAEPEEQEPADPPVPVEPDAAPGTALALVEPDEPAPARPRPSVPEPEAQGLAARLRRRRQDRRVRRGKAVPEPTAAEQISAADAVRALRATLDLQRTEVVDHGDAGALDDDVHEAEVLDLTPVPWARAAELQERLRLAEAGLLDPDTLMDLSVLSGGRP